MKFYKKKRLEKDYMNVKKDEQEEQIELRVIESLILIFEIKKLN
jgi:hypothetical protein